MCLGAQVPEIMTKQYVNDDDGNIYRSKLGVYRGNQPAFHNDHPVIFENDSSAPNMLAHGAAGFLTNEKGIVGTFSSKSYLQGKTRLIVYGDPKSGKASSWTLLEWASTGKKFHESNSELYEWKRIPNVKAALSKSGLYESLEAFNKSKINK